MMNVVAVSSIFASLICHCGSANSNVDESDATSTISKLLRISTNTAVAKADLLLKKTSI